MATKYSSSSVLFVLALVLMVYVTNDVANASSLTVWSGPGCRNGQEILNACGCSAINLRGGWLFTYTGQTASLYNQPGCTGVVHTRLNNTSNGARSCSGFGWNSMLIQC